MSTVNLDTITSKTIADIAVRAGNDQLRINHVCTLAFAGQTLKAPVDTILHGALDILIERKNAFNIKRQKAADKALEAGLYKTGSEALKAQPKFQAINMLSTMIGRWLRVQERFNGKRVSIKSTGKDACIALITPKAPDASDTKEETAKKDKAAKAALSGTKNLPEALKALVDAYGYASVAAQLTKLK